MSFAAAPLQASLRSQTAPRTVSVLGATGSIGTSTADVLRRHADRYDVQAVTAGANATALASVARGLRAKFAAVADPNAFGALKDALAGTGIEAAAGPQAIVEAAQRPADWIMAAISGADGLAPTLAALDQGRTVALANKECLVCAGALFMRRAAATGACVMPVDSEHNAVFQSLAAGHSRDVRRVIITASGGPFRTLDKAALGSVTIEAALKHPNWSMGQKITIDSATMMNKGLELIEAHHLFNLPSAQLDVLVHPQSVVHGMVEFRDGSVIAALGTADMRIPISHCLAWPGRLDATSEQLDLARIGTLTFADPDTERFPALRLARAALEAGQGAPTVLNAANEVAVAKFLAGRIAFLGIPSLVEAVIERAQARGMMREPASLEEALALDRGSREMARAALPEFALLRS